MSTVTGICNLCLRDLLTGAVYTGECSHKFHYNCVYYHIQNGKHVCPTCNSLWTQLPSPFPLPSTTPVDPLYRYARSPSPPPYVDPLDRYVPPPTETYEDDEPLPSSATSSTHQRGEMTVKAMPEYPALSKSDKSDSFPVLVSIRAPLLSTEASDARAPLDLVAVLDVSGSMFGHKLSLLKQAVSFVVKNLGPTDRLSIITFSSEARRICAFRRMTEVGQTNTLRVVESIETEGSTNIIAGLKLAVEALEQRREKNPVASIILLSDGADTDNYNFISCLSQLSPSIRSNASERNQSQAPSDIFQVYTFGFGADHDARALHAISDGSGGTFSYIEAIEVIQDAFAQCLGGLLSVVAQQVELHVKSGSSDVVIKSVPSGRYQNTFAQCLGGLLSVVAQQVERHVKSGSSNVVIKSIPSGRYRNTFDRQHGIIYLGDVYADEEKQFLVYLTVPKVKDENNVTTKLLEVKCSYKDPLSNEKIVSETAIAEIRRPLKEALSEEDNLVCLEVDREKNRILIAEGIAQAQVMAERGELERARSLLEVKKETMLLSRVGNYTDEYTMSLFSQARMMQMNMETEDEYFSNGRAYGLSAHNSHMYQRANTNALRSGSGSAFGSIVDATKNAFGFQTAHMQKMVKKSKQERESTGQKP